MYNSLTDGLPQTDTSPGLLSSQKEYASSNPTKSGSASDKMGELYRFEWNDYVTRFQPYDSTLINLATSDSDNQAAIKNAQAGVSGSFDTARGTLQRNNERLGLSTANDVKNSLDRQSAMSQTAAEVGAINNTRLHALDRDQSIMAGNAAVGLKDTGGVQ